jgi:hypothetical protein
MSRCRSAEGPPDLQISLGWPTAPLSIYGKSWLERRLRLGAKPQAMFEMNPEKYLRTEKSTSILLFSTRW